MHTWAQLGGGQGQARSQVSRFDGARCIFRGQSFCFNYKFKTNFSGRNKIWGGAKEIWGGAKQILGALPPNSPRGYGPGQGQRVLHFFRRDVSPLFQTGKRYNILCPLIFFSLGFHLKRCQNKSDVCQVFCEEFFMFDVADSKFDDETESALALLILIFLIRFCFDKMVLAFCKFLGIVECFLPILKVLNAFVRRIILCGVVCSRKAHCVETMRVEQLHL